MEETKLSEARIGNNLNIFGLKLSNGIHAEDVATFGSLAFVEDPKNQQTHTEFPDFYLGKSKVTDDLEIRNIDQGTEDKNVQLKEAN